MAVIEVDGIIHKIEDGMTVKQALEFLGYRINKFPEDQGLFMPCQTGGCWTCARDIDGNLSRACISKVRDGIRLTTNPKDFTPVRLVSGFMGHQVGGVGTPWWLKGRYIEIACFTAGCNFVCPQCQNWNFTYMNSGKPLSPEEAAGIMTTTRRIYGVDRLAISGGECTLNRSWLVKYLHHLKEKNPDARLHVDTNGSILTPDYLDELVNSGMTDIGIDLKALNLQTFQAVTGLGDAVLAEKYLHTAWNAVDHLINEHPRVFVGIGIPYNKELISLTEVEDMGKMIFDMDPWIQVCVLDYRPAFKRLDISRPSYAEMACVHELLTGMGLESVLCQTEKGRIGPDGDLIRFDSN
jgi:pyruvate formate lyase activating enzyme